MSPENFCYWLRGFIEISSATKPELLLGPEQLKVINDHLDLVMVKKTPEHPGPVFRDQQAVQWGPRHPDADVRVRCDYDPLPKRYIPNLTCSAPEIMEHGPINSSSIGFRDWRISDPHAPASIFDINNRGFRCYGT